MNHIQIWIQLQQTALTHLFKHLFCSEGSLIKRALFLKLQFFVASYRSTL